MNVIFANLSITQSALACRSEYDSIQQQSDPNWFFWCETSLDMMTELWRK